MVHELERLQDLVVVDQLDCTRRPTRGVERDPEFAESVAQQVPQMAGVEVVARIVPRQDYDLPMGEVKAFWRAYFDKTGATFGSTN